MRQNKVIADQMERCDYHAHHYPSRKEKENHPILEKTLIASEQYVKEEDRRRETYHTGYCHFEVQSDRGKMCSMVIRV